MSHASHNGRSIRVENVYPPIPIRDFDWCATFVSYEPGEPQGYGSTEQAAIADLLEKLEMEQTP